MTSIARVLRNPTIRLATVVVVVMAAGVLLFLRYGGDTVAIDSYEVTDNPAVIRVVALPGEGGWTRVTEVRQDSREVTIVVRQVEMPGPHADVGWPTPFLVHLDHPLGDRILKDALGRTIARSH